MAQLETGFLQVAHPPRHALLNGRFAYHTRLRIVRVEKDGVICKIAHDLWQVFPRKGLKHSFNNILTWALSWFVSRLDCSLFFCPVRWLAFGHCDLSPCLFIVKSLKMVCLLGLP